MKIEHGEIKVSKLAKGVCTAECNILKPIKSSVSMRGESEGSAKQKLELFLNDKPYNHIK